MRINVAHGTAVNEARPCDNCGQAVVMKGSSTNEEVIHCYALQKTVPIRVVECNRFEERGRPSLFDMREIAWVLHVDSKRQKIGFRTASEWRKEHEDEVLVPSFLE